MIPNLTAVCVILLPIIMSLRKYRPFQKWVASKVEASLNKFNKYEPVSTNFKLCKDPYLSESLNLNDINNALTSLNEYRVRGLGQNSIIYQRTKSLDGEMKKQLSQLQYFEKVESINRSILTNFNIITSIIEHTLFTLIKYNGSDSKARRQIDTMIQELGYSFTHDKIVKTNQEILQEKSNQLRVNEAISHIVRDWSSSYYNERKPLTEFVLHELEPMKGAKDILIIVPGSGCGNISWEIAKYLPDADVHSVELSTLMYICNEFVLSYDKPINIAPFSQYYSDQLTSLNQVQSFDVNLSNITKPTNLTIHLGDFCKFQPLKQYKQIIICTVFFIDTAENIFSYFNAIEGFKDFTHELRWINIGPLKYGTRPLVQLTNEELTKLRKIRGWEDIINEVDTKDLTGYLTDYKSLYQGYYGLVKFHSIYKSNYLTSTTYCT